MNENFHAVSKFFLIFTFIAFLFSFANSALASRCFLMKDLSSTQFLVKEGECDKRVSPNSSFKIALSLMGFDSGILKDETSPEWHYKDHYNASIESWKLPHNPTTWIRDSCTWYSQKLAAALGFLRFQSYVRDFSYGNQDVSGDPGMHNGLSVAWLDSSLKISPEEQLNFLEKLLTNRLPVSEKAIRKTKRILYIEHLINGWKLSGKTGTIYRVREDGTFYADTHNGWFVGWAEKEGRRVVFVQFFQDENLQAEPGGEHGRENIKTILEKMK